MIRLLLARKPLYDESKHGRKCGQDAVLMKKSGDEILGVSGDYIIG